MTLGGIPQTRFISNWGFSTNLRRTSESVIRKRSRPRMGHSRLVVFRSEHRRMVDHSAPMRSARGRHLARSDWLSDIMHLFMRWWASQRMALLGFLCDCWRTGLGLKGDLREHVTRSKYLAARERGLRKRATSAIRLSTRSTKSDSIRLSMYWTIPIRMATSRERSSSGSWSLFRMLSALGLSFRKGVGGTGEKIEPVRTVDPRGRLKIYG